MTRPLFTFSGAPSALNHGTHGQADVPFTSVCRYRMGRNAFAQPTAESSASLEQPCSVGRLLIYPYYFFLLEDNLMNCVAAGLSNITDPGLHRKL